MPRRTRTARRRRVLTRLLKPSAGGGALWGTNDPMSYCMLAFSARQNASRVFHEMTRSEGLIYLALRSAMAACAAASRAIGTRYGEQET